MKLQNNYYALCILLRLFYSKDIAITHSYFKVQKNIIENCITIYNIKKQKEILDKSIKYKNSDDIDAVLKHSNFYGLLTKIMNNSDPITKLKNMEQKRQNYGNSYSKEPTLNGAFYACQNNTSAPKTPIIPSNAHLSNAQKSQSAFKKIIKVPSLSNFKTKIGKGTNKRS